MILICFSCHHIDCFLGGVLSIILLPYTQGPHHSQHQCLLSYQAAIPWLFAYKELFLPKSKKIWWPQWCNVSNGYVACVRWFSMCLFFEWIFFRRFLILQGRHRKLKKQRYSEIFVNAYSKACAYYTCHCHAFLQILLVYQTAFRDSLLRHLLEVFCLVKEDLIIDQYDVMRFIFGQRYF